MFYEQLKKACKQNGTTVTATLKKIGIGTANGTYWTNGSAPSADIVIKLSEFLNVTTDYLLLGKEENTISLQSEGIHQTDGREQELLRNFRLLPDNQKDQLIGRVQLMAEQAAETRKAV
ncbi:MAG: helix-turn-helix domain-containing protein [Oscillospiraceae bacterium]|nr:helix-turn-helix domain-containing protein [Oscillospiraceae bacterium]